MRTKMKNSSHFVWMIVFVVTHYLNKIDRWISTTEGLTQSQALSCF